MSKREKLLLRFRTNPKTVRFEEIDTLLLWLGFEKHQSGSHATYAIEQYLITVPFRKPYILLIYVKSSWRFLMKWKHRRTQNKQQEEEEYDASYQNNRRVSTASLHN